MHRILRLMATGAQRRPGRVLLALALVTVALGGFAGQQQTDTDPTAFAPEGELAESLELVQDQFAAGGVSTQVIFDAGEDGDVLAPDHVAFADELVAALAGDPEVSEALAAGERALASFTAGLAESGAPMAPELLSQDDADASSARAGLVVVNLDADLELADAAEAELRVGEIVEGMDPPDGLDVEAFGQFILNDRLESGSEGEMSSLLGLSILLIVGILALQFRTASDVALGLVGLLASITWMFGIGVLLGPDYLGVVGYFTQVSIIVPVLLVGLGVDYSIHLTSRYREERRHGLAADRSASAAVRTVGGALALATVATMLGFLTNVISPLPPMGDFGIFTAVGVISAFVVMGLLIPSARNLLDTRQVRRGRTPRWARAGSTADVDPLGRVMAKTSVLADRAPKAVIGAALVVTVLAGLAATQIRTSFSQDDFIPEESEIGQLLTRIETLFGGDIAESTFVVMAGDLADPAALNAVAAVGADLADVEYVRVAGGVAQVQSPFTVLAGLAGSDAELAAQLDELGFSATEGVADDADVAAMYELGFSAAPAQMSTVIDPGHDLGVLSVSTQAGQDNVGDLAESMSAAVEPLSGAGVDTRLTSELLVIDDTLNALAASQARGIAFTLVAALALLVSYYGIAERRPVIGVITMIPSVAVVAWVLGTMWLLGYSFNVLTAMVASLGIGIGVPFGIHMTHRFLEDRRRYDTLDEAVRQTLTHTGGAMAGSAATTAAGFGVLVFASLVPIQQFGTIVAITILYSFLAAVLVQPSCLKLWAEWRARRGDVVELDDADDHRVPEPVG
ncbi:MAG: MMPL family transporter [Acidimicrobiales bacterium]|nr:MMPL family transporter [Acidimicrobiales bacterium]